MAAALLGTTPAAQPSLDRARLFQRRMVAQPRNDARALRGNAAEHIFAISEFSNSPDFEFISLRLALLQSVGVEPPDVPRLGLHWHHWRSSCPLWPSSGVQDARADFVVSREEQIK